MEAALLYIRHDKFQLSQHERVDILPLHRRKEPAWIALTHELCLFQLDLSRNKGVAYEVHSVISIILALLVTNRSLVCISCINLYLEFKAVVQQKHLQYIINRPCLPDVKIQNAFISVSLWKGARMGVSFRQE